MRSLFLRGHSIFGYVWHFGIRISDLRCPICERCAVVEIMGVITGILHEIHRLKEFAPGKEPINQS